MSTRYVLIDFENVQPKNLEILARHAFHVLVFVGANQTKVPYELAQAMQALGTNAQYLKIAGNGRNALDFHIAYYLGELATKEPDAQFHVISKDTGFDPLIKHLIGRKIQVQREKDLAEIPELRISSAHTDDEKIDAIVKNLAARGQSRPRSVKTLGNTIKSLFATSMTEPELSSIVEQLQKREFILVKGTRISYKLTDG